MNIGYLPITPGIAVVSPMGNERLIGQNGIETVRGRAGEVEIFSPRIDSLLSS